MLDILTANGHTVSTLKAKVYSFSRPSGGTPALAREKTVICSGTEHFVLVVAVTRQHVVPCKCISPAEGLFRFDEKETVETMEDVETLCRTTGGQCKKQLRRCKVFFNGTRCGESAWMMLRGPQLLDILSRQITKF